MSIAVSLIMPVYNAEKYLAESIESALGQSLKEIELICIDDGSTDSSSEILEKYATRDPRIKIIKQKNQGPGAARNAGIAQALGNYLCFLDSDDLYGDESYLATLYSAATSQNQKVAGGGFIYYQGPGKTQDPSIDPLYAGYSFPREGTISYRDFQFDYGFHRFIFSRELFKGGGNRFNSLSYYEDPIWLSRVLNQAESFYACRSAHYLYRIDHKPVAWTTKKILDLLEGVRHNLEFSSQNGLAKLHWYTVQHLDESTHYTGVGLVDGLDVGAISKKLEEIEVSIDRNLLAEVDPNDASYAPSLRKQMDAARKMSLFERKVAGAIFLTKRRFAPLYHKLTG